MIRSRTNAFDSNTVNNLNNFQVTDIVEECNTISEVLEKTSEKHSESIFLIENDNEWKYKEFNRLVNQCCYFFSAQGICSGDTISIILRNSIDFLIIYFAALRSHIIVNPFPYHVAVNEVLSKIGIVNPKGVFSHKSHYKLLSESDYRVFNLDDFDGKSFLETLSNFSANAYKSPEVNNDETAILYYSSGTTGVPKIIEYSQKSMMANQAAMISAGCAEPNSVHICVLPLGHTAALNNLVFHCIFTGSTVVLFESFWKIRSNLWDVIQSYKATYMVVVPTILMAILNTPYKDYNREKVSSMKFIGCGSAFLAKNLQDAFEEKFGIAVANLYGSSETGATHFDNPFEFGRRTGNIGSPLDNVKVKIINEHGNEVQKDEVGEFCIKSPALLKGYFNDRKSYNACFNNGYFMTGDLGYKDENGVYYYVDRKKDLIIKGGVNILPSEIDAVLQAHPAVVEAATIGKPDMLLGENIKSYIILKNNMAIDQKILKTYCKKELGDFKTPTEFEFVDDLPKGPSGKILKKELREKELIDLL